MLKYRVISSALIILVLLAVAMFMPLAGLVPVIAFIALLATIEFSRFLTAAEIPHAKGIAAVGGTAWVALAGWAPLQMGAAEATELELLLVLALVLLTFCVVLFTPDAQPLVAIPATLAALFYAPFLMTFLAKLVTGLGGDGRTIALYMILVVKLTDMGAYFTGSAIGKTKVFPRISPAKTWEGCLGGVGVATLAAVGVAWAAGGNFGVVHIPILHALALGVLLSITGILGDLLESMFKRAAGVKDSGNWIRGMGGVLDVMDSLILAAPVLYVYCRFVIS